MDLDQFAQKHGLVLDVEAAPEVPCWICVIMNKDAVELLTFMPWENGIAPPLAEVLRSTAVLAGHVPGTPCRVDRTLWELQVTQREQLLDLLGDEPYDELLAMVA